MSARKNEAGSASSANSGANGNVSPDNELEAVAQSTKALSGSLDLDVDSNIYRRFVDKVNDADEGDLGTLVASRAILLKIEENQRSAIEARKKREAEQKAAEQRRIDEREEQERQARNRRIGRGLWRFIKIAIVLAVLGFIAYHGYQFYLTMKAEADMLDAQLGNNQRYLQQFEEAGLIVWVPDPGTYADEQDDGYYEQTKVDDVYTWWSAYYYYNYLSWNLDENTKAVAASSVSSDDISGGKQTSTGKRVYDDTKYASAEEYARDQDYGGLNVWLTYDEAIATRDYLRTIYNDGMGRGISLSDLVVLQELLDVYAYNSPTALWTQRNTAQGFGGGNYSANNSALYALDGGYFDLTSTAY